MSGIEDELRTTLRTQANRAQLPLDLVPRVESRARSMRRRRNAAAGGVATLAVVGLVVGVSTLLGGHSPEHTPPLASSSAPPTLAASPSPSPTGTAKAALSAYVLDPADPWPYRGDPRVSEAGTLAPFQRAWESRHPGSKLHPLWGEIYEPSQLPELVAFAQTSDGPRWAFLSGSANGVRIVVDQPLKPHTTALLATVPGDEVARLIVVAAPEAKTIRYAADGRNYTDMYALAPGVAVHPREGTPGTDRVQVIGAEGEQIFEDLVP
ncbi:MAG: hypothetical protein K6T28_00135 [Acidothermus sp.]|nr:hypothetical protein [Acidothermus sp.]